MADTSTPKWEYRVQEDLNMSPINFSPVFNLSSSVDTLGSSFSSPGNNPELQTLGISPLLKKLLIRPKDFSEEQENRMLLIETVNLTRAAMWKGLIEEDDLKYEMDKLVDNAFFRLRHFGVDNILSLQLESLHIAQWAQEDYCNILRESGRRDKRKGVLWLVDHELNMEESYERIKFFNAVPEVREKSVVDS